MPTETARKTILITGASRGLGYKLTEESLKRGFTVYAGVRSPDACPLLDNLDGQYPGRIRRIALDMADEGSIRRACEELSAQMDSLDAVINNAAVLLEREKTIEELDFDQLRLTFAVNTFGPMYLIQQLLPLIYKGSSPVIVNVSSESGTILNAFSTNYAYSMSKTALNMFTERLRHYLSGRDIQAYAVHPGWMRTDMGGEEAPGDPVETANGIMDMIERKLTITSKISFVNHQGKPMPL